MKSSWKLIETIQFGIFKMKVVATRYLTRFKPENRRWNIHLNSTNANVVDALKEVKFDTYHYPIKLE